MAGEELAGLGQAIEGAAVARAVEPERGEIGATLAKDGHFDEAACRNCGTILDGAYCSGCGQKAHLHRTLTAFWHDLLHGALHFDGKLWRTLPLLAWQPGKLTRRYIEGERARFISPMALFLFSVFLMFAVFSAIGLTTPTQIDTGATMRVGVEAARKAAAEDVERLTARLEATQDAAEQSDLERRIGERQDEIEGLESALSEIDKSMPSDFMIGEDTNSAFLAELGEKWRSNPGLMLYKLQANSYKFGWLLIPLSIPFVWLLFFWRREFKAYDHAIFVTYSIAFMSLLFIVVSVLIKIGVSESVYGSVIVFVPPLHLYRHLRGAYGLGRRATLWRLAVLSLFIMLVATLYMIALLFLGAF